MVFKIKDFSCYNPLQKFGLQWVLLCTGFILLPNANASYSKEEIYNLPDEFVILFAVMENRNQMYSTISRTIGSLNFQALEEAKTIKHIESEQVTLKLSSYEAFYNEIYPKVTRIKYLNQLPDKLNKYLDKLNLKDLQLVINLIIIPFDYRTFFESTKSKSKSDKLDLTFIVSYKKEEKGEDKTNVFEKNILHVLPHEVFHLLDLHSSYIKTKSRRSLRKETYADIFGVCIAYDISQTIIVTEKNLNFPEYFFENPTEDLNKVRKKLIKKIKKGELFETSLSKFIARYYFQAVANNYTGKDIKSDKISKFCHKLFSEHDFKHPIEKKPPPWFIALLEE